MMTDTTGSSTRRHWRLADRFAMLGWPLMALVAILILWATVEVRGMAERSSAERNALRDSASYAQSYGQFLSRSVSQMDQVTMQLKYDWEHSQGRFGFEELIQRGMFTDTAFVSVSIYDNQGALKTSTRSLTAPVSIAGSLAFQFHKNNNSTALRIDLPDAGPKSGQLRFSRRLETGDDGFDGMIVMVMDATYFTTFYNASTVGVDGFVEMLSVEGDGHAETQGTAAGSGGSLFQASATVGSSDAGAQLESGKHFRDGKLRYVGWQRLQAYPLIAVVGLSQAEVLDATIRTQRDRYFNAALASAALIAFAMVATFLSHRLAVRQDEKEAIRDAYRTATDNASDGFYMVHPVRNAKGAVVDFCVVDCNERGASFYGLARAQMIGERVSALPSLRADPDLMARLVQALSLDRYEEDVQMPSDPRIRIQWARRTLVRAGAGLAITLHDISRQKRHEGQLERLANEDTLTGLPNRYWLLNHLPQAIDRARNAGTILGLLFVDLDGFKHVNDTQGHAVGDALLKIAGDRLTGLLRPSDSVVRLGGDEFVVILDPLEQREQTAPVAQRVLEAFNLPFEIGDEIQLVGASVGISVFPEDGDDAMTLIKHGDIAMYSGKSEGKGQFRYYQPQLYERLREKAQGKQDLLEALAQDQLVLHYQPRVDTATGELCSMEALVRWQHPTRGMVPPLDFIPLAESSGLIMQLGDIVMQKACRQIAAWRDAGLPLVPVSINVSPAQFSKGKVHRHLASCLAAYGVPPRLLEVEITESAMMGDQEEVLGELSALRDLGVRLHIDDFGTGYSSLSQLQKLKMDVLKVDRAFTHELANSKDGKVFFQAIVSMAHALGMEVVAEGVETAEQIAILQSLRCNEVQGYFVSRPVAPDLMAELMRRRLLYAPGMTSIGIPLVANA